MVALAKHDHRIESLGSHRLIRGLIAKEVFETSIQILKTLIEFYTHQFQCDGTFDFIHTFHLSFTVKGL